VDQVLSTLLPAPPPVHIPVAAPAMAQWTGLQGAQYRLVQTMDQFWSFYTRLTRQRMIAVDTETSGLDWVRDRACGLVFGWGLENNYYLPIGHETTDPQLNLDDIREPLRKVIENPDVTKLFWNKVFDQHFLDRCGMTLKGPSHDGVILVHLLDENSDKGLKEVARLLIGKTADVWEKSVDSWRVDESKRRRREFSKLITDTLTARRVDLENEVTAQNPLWRYSGMTKAQVTNFLKKRVKAGLETHPYANAKKGDITYDKVPLSILAPYACADVHYTWMIWKQLFPDVAKHDALRSLYINEMHLSQVLYEVEQHGVKIDIAHLDRIEPEFIKAMEEAEADVYRDIGYRFNIESNEELLAALRKAGCPLNKLTKKGQEVAREGGEPTAAQFSVDKEVLEELAATYEFANKVLSFREKQKLLNTYVRKIRLLVDEHHYLHSTFNANVDTGRMSSRDPNCFTGDTEVLTPDGWRRLDDLPRGVPVAQWRDNAVEFVMPTEYIKHYRKEELVHVQNQQIDLLMTPDHRCFLVNRDGLGGFCSASEYPSNGTHHKQLHAGIYAGGSLRMSEQEVVLLAATQADGSYADRTLDFSFKKHRKIDRLEWALQGLGFSYSKRISLSGRVRIRVPAGECVEWVRSYLGDAKQLGSWLLSCDRPTLDLWCQELFFWDGCWRTRSQYASMHRRNVDWAQIVLCLSGYRAKIREYKTPRDTVCYVVDSTARNYSYTDNAVITRIAHDGFVYCLSVPSKVILTRHNGRVCVTGQCQNIPGKNLEIRRSFIVPDDDYVFVFADYSQVELRLTAHWSQDPTLLAAYSPTAPGWAGHELDIHSLTCADVVLQRPLPEVLAILKDKNHPENHDIKWFRNIAKRVNFGIIYGAGPGAIQRQVSTPKRRVSREACAEYIKGYFQRYRGVKAWVDHTELMLRRQGYIQNSFGRFRRLPNIHSNKKWERARAARQGGNFLIQGDAADTFKTAIVRVNRILKAHNARTRIVNFVHDEIQFYWHKKELPLLGEVKKAMEDFQFRVPIVVDFGFSRRDWAAKQELKL